MEREDGTKLNFFPFLILKEHDVLLKELKGTLGKRMYALFLTTLTNHSFILYCWLSEKKQDCRNAEMKKILIIIQRLSQNERIKSNFLFFSSFFFEDNSQFFLHFLCMCTLIATSSSCIHFFALVFSFFFGLKVKWNRTDADVWEERQLTLASLHLKITSKCM